jgi:hypothetical protein
MAETVNASFFRNAGIAFDKSDADLRSQGAKTFDESWSKLLDAIEVKAKCCRSRLAFGESIEAYPARSGREERR